MKITTYSYRFAEAVLKDAAFLKAYKHLVDVLKAVTPPLYSVKKVKVRKRGKGSARFFPVDQKQLNKDIEASMTGWEIRPLVVKGGGSGPVTNIRSDFKKDRIQVEVQFGNMARWYTDVFKFQLAYSRDHIDVGILVVPTQKLANLIDENVASFERVSRELPWAKMSLTLPILVIGVEPEDYGDIKARYEEKAAQWSDENKGESVRPFAKSLEAQPEPEESEE